MDRLAEKWMELLESSFQIITTCPCAEGCLSCIFSPTCGDYNRRLDKQGAILILTKLLGKNYP